MHVPSKAIRPRVEVLASAPIPTHFGEFTMQVFRVTSSETEAADMVTGLSPDHVALIAGEPNGAEDLLVRVHSECLTSEVFGSLKCDCKEQLEHSQRIINAAGRGLVLYLRQEGRGIGLSNKIRAYGLQHLGHDTVDANRMLGLPDDARRYDAAAGMLEHLGVRSIRLLTNNPAKVTDLERLGVRVTGHEPVRIASNPHSARYLDTKRDRMGHWLPVARQ